MKQTQMVEGRKPNIIFIMTDDLGYNDLGCYGQENIQTPHIDHLAVEGILFTQCYVRLSFSDIVFFAKVSRQVKQLQQLIRARSKCFPITYAYRLFEPTPEVFPIQKAILQVLLLTEERG